MLLNLYISMTNLSIRTVLLSEKLNEHQNMWISDHTSDLACFGWGFFGIILIYHLVLPR